MFLELQLKYLLWLQNLRILSHEFYTLLFFYITSLGEYLIPIMTCAAIYWCIDKKLGSLIILNSALSLITTQLLKNFACIARPWILDSRIKPADIALPHAGGYSFPSGHSALAVSCWGSIGLWYKKNKKVLISAIIICLLVAFSRNYLGVHTLQDIIIGLLVATIVLIITYKLLTWCENGKRRDLILALTVSAISTIIIAYTYFKSYPDIYDSAGNIIANTKHSKLSGFPKLGLVFGSFWGWYFERNFIKFDPKLGSTKTKIIRLIIGLGLFTLLTIFFSTLIKQRAYKGAASFAYMLIVGLFITLIYPWIVTKISLLKNKR